MAKENQVNGNVTQADIDEALELLRKHREGKRSAKERATRQRFQNALLARKAREAGLVVTEDELQAYMAANQRQRQPQES